MFIDVDVCCVPWLGCDRLGRPGVDSHVRHETDAAVVQIVFLTNEGALVTATADDSLHLWNFRQKRPEVVHSLKFQRERWVQGWPGHWTQVTLGLYLANGFEY